MTGVLIVAKCNVNKTGTAGTIRKEKVLIVAKCNVNHFLQKINSF